MSRLLVSSLVDSWMRFAATGTFIFLAVSGATSLAQLQDISSVSDATLPATSEKFELGRSENPGINSQRSLREARGQWVSPTWSPEPTPNLYPLSRTGPIGEDTQVEPNLAPPLISR